jgi:hypothetical protein
MWLTDLADALRAGGLRVTEVDGWKTRGYLNQQMTAVRSVITHWTATNPGVSGDYPTLRTIINGTAETPGPLAQLGLGRGGTFYVCAAGLCNHAGVVDHTDHANPRAVGIEAEYHPDQGPWPAVQIDAYYRGCAVLARHYRFDNIEWQVRGHYEVAQPIGRKQDPNTVPGGMPRFRDKVRALLEGQDDVSAADFWNHILVNPADNHPAEAWRWVIGTARDSERAYEAAEAAPKSVWTHRLDGDPTPDGKPFDEEAHKWLTDRARDGERIRRLETLMEAIAAKLGVPVPAAIEQTTTESKSRLHPE